MHSGTADPNLRDVVEAIQYIACNGCQWRMLPKDFPPVSTARGYFYAWRNQGLWYAINHLLVAATRELEGREASPMAGVITFRRLLHNRLSVRGQPKRENYRSSRGLRV